MTDQEPSPSPHRLERDEHGEWWVVTSFAFTEAFMREVERSSCTGLSTGPSQLLPNTGTPGSTPS